MLSKLAWSVYARRSCLRTEWISLQPYIDRYQSFKNKVFKDCIYGHDQERDSNSYLLFPTFCQWASRLPSLKETLVTKPKPRGFRVSTFSLQERQTLSNFWQHFLCQLTKSSGGPGSGLFSLDRTFYRRRQTMHSCDNGLYSLCRRVYLAWMVKVSNVFRQVVLYSAVRLTCVRQ